LNLNLNLNSSNKLPGQFFASPDPSYLKFGIFGLANQYISRWHWAVNHHTNVVNLNPALELSLSFRRPGTTAVTRA